MGLSIGLRGLSLTGVRRSGASLAPPLYDINFAAGDALPAGFTFARNTAAWRRNSSGVWESVGNNVPRYHHDAAGSPLGYLVEGTRTSRALWNRDLTNVVWVKTNLTAAKNVTGIDAVASSASTLTATGAAGTCLQTLTLASGSRIFQPWVRRKTGAGTVEITLDGGTGWTNVTGLINSSTYSQVSVTATITNPSVGFRLGTSGDEIEVDFAELTDGTVMSAPVAPTTTATVARTNEVLTGPSWTADWSVIAIARVSLVAAEQNAVVIGSGAVVQGIINTARLFRWDLGAVVNTTVNAINSGASNKFGAAGSATGSSLVLNGGAAATNANPHGLVGTVRLGINFALNGFLHGTLSRFKFWDRALSIAELQAETS